MLTTSVGTQALHSCWSDCTGAKIYSSNYIIADIKLIKPCLNYNLSIIPWLVSQLILKRPREQSQLRLPFENMHIPTGKHNAVAILMVPPRQVLLLDRKEHPRSLFIYLKQDLVRNDKLYVLTVKLYRCHQHETSFDIAHVVKSFVSYKRSLWEALVDGAGRIVAYQPATQLPTRKRIH